MIHNGDWYHSNEYLICSIIVERKEVQSLNKKRVKEIIKLRRTL